MSLSTLVSIAQERGKILSNEFVHSCQYCTGKGGKIPLNESCTGMWGRYFLEFCTGKCGEFCMERWARFSLELLYRKVGKSIRLAQEGGSLAWEIGKDLLVLQSKIGKELLVLHRKVEKIILLVLHSKMGKELLVLHRKVEKTIVLVL